MPAVIDVLPELNLVMVGAGTPFTVTPKLAWLVLLCASVAEQFTVVGPTGNVLPEAGVQLGVTAPSTRSVALAV